MAKAMLITINWELDKVWTTICTSQEEATALRDSISGDKGWEGCKWYVLPHPDDVAARMAAIEAL